MNSIAKYILIPVLVAGLFSSCKPGKGPFKKRDKDGDTEVVTDGSATGTDKGTKADNKANNNDTATVKLSDLDSKEKQQLMSESLPLWNKSLSYTTFSGRAKMHYEGMGQKQDFTTNFRVYKDSVIWASVSALGGMVNVARAVITKDSIFVVSYLEKKAYVMAIEETDKLLPAAVDYGIMQNFIIGEALSKSGNLVDVLEFGNLLNLQVMSNDIIQQVYFNKADSTMNSLQMIANKGRGSLAGMIQYGAYEKVDSRKFAKDRVINLNSDGMRYYMTMNFNKVSFDEELSFPFSIPSSYRVNAE